MPAHGQPSSNMLGTCGPGHLHCRCIHRLAVTQPQQLILARKSVATCDEAIASAHSMRSLSGVAGRTQRAVDELDWDGAQRVAL